MKEPTETLCIVLYLKSNNVQHVSWLINNIIELIVGPHRFDFWCRSRWMLIDNLWCCFYHISIMFKHDARCICPEGSRVAYERVWLKRRANQMWEEFVEGKRECNICQENNWRERRWLAVSSCAGRNETYGIQPQGGMQHSEPICRYLQDSIQWISHVQNIS